MKILLGTFAARFIRILGTVHQQLPKGTAVF